ncbi:MAG: hypothetical protein LBU83_13020 [Bacteroidales bacterium]|jgi:hypothetical protein|nr:hypothetical protein [Bacteroidales bacterium]
MKKFIFIFCCSVLALFFSCNTSNKLGGYYSYETECLGTELDGSYTLRAWGVGRSQVDAMEQARKNAVRDVIFKGITKGKSECQIKPILMEVNAYDKYRDYFNKFFIDNGTYNKYVNYKDKRFGSSIRQRTGSEIKYGVIVRVKYAEIKEKLINDNILKTF